MLVALVLVISYASSLRAWLRQHDELAEARAQISSSTAQISELKQQKRRWKDPAYVKLQARDRFGWVLPGEVGYRVVGADGKPLGDSPQLRDAPVGHSQDTQWYDRLWHSVRAAGGDSDAQRPDHPHKVIKPKRDDTTKDGETGQ